MEETVQKVKVTGQGQTVRVQRSVFYNGLSLYVLYFFFNENLLCLQKQLESLQCISCINYNDLPFDIHEMFSFFFFRIAAKPP